MNNTQLKEAACDDLTYAKSTLSLIINNDVPFDTHAFKRSIDGVKYQIDLDAEVLTQALISLYENKACKDAGYTVQQILDSYANYYNKNGNITPDGEMFISLITELIAENMHRKEFKNDPV
ncbi:hypothetical protein Q4S20_13635 [Morganella morganii]